MNREEMDDEESGIEAKILKYIPEAQRNWYLHFKQLRENARLERLSKTFEINLQIALNLKVFRSRVGIFLHPGSTM